MSDDWLTIKEAAAHCGLSTKTIERRIADGTLHSRKVLRGRRPYLQVWTPSLDTLRPAPVDRPPTAPPTPTGQLETPPAPVLLATLREHADAQRRELQELRAAVEAQRQDIQALTAALRPRPPWWRRLFRRQ